MENSHNTNISRDNSLSNSFFSGINANKMFVTNKSSLFKRPAISTFSAATDAIKKTRLQYFRARAFDITAKPSMHISLEIRQSKERKKAIS